MAANIPSSLKAADIGRFVTRAAQVERPKPVIAYWCNYWAVNQIISKGLHNADEEATQFTTNLMDKLEQFKSENSDNDAITDNVAGQAYVEQFGLEVFSRADNAVRANKASKQTADTFLAAATFLELCQIWGDLDPDIASKIKFAKYHAIRIAKAIKNGEDPNLSNPVEEHPRQSSEGEALDPSDPEVQAIQGTSTQPPTRGRQASVEEVPDESDRIQRQLAQQSTLDESLHPSRSSSIPPPQAKVPLDTAASTAGGVQPPELPPAPSDLQLPQVPPSLPDTPKSINESAAFQSFPPPVSAPAPGVPDIPQPPSTFSAPKNPTISTHAPAIPTAAPISSHAPPVPAPGPAVNTTQVDDNSITQAQKHARWAVSALSFDDVNTAIKELKIALQHLGAQ